MTGPRNVLVGALHTAGQLQANLDHRFYHIPAKLLAVAPERAGYIALYQSRRLFGEGAAGVSYYGGVSGFRLVERGEIAEPPARNPRELYCRFQVEEWLRLRPPIRAVGLAPGVCMLTSLFLLQNSRDFPELYLRTGEQHRLYRLLRAACRRTLATGGSELLPGAAGYTVMAAGWTLGVYSPAGEYEQRDLREFYRNPHGFLQRMEKFIDLPPE